MMFQNWETEGLLFLGRLFFISFSVIYAFFAFIVVRQVSLMNESFHTKLQGLFTFIAWAHFFASLLGIAIVFLLS
jgi:hypothetical protein